MSKQEKSPDKVIQAIPKHTAHIEITGYGTSETGARYVELRFPTTAGSHQELLRIDNLNQGTKSSDPFSRLNRLGAHIISSAARTELLNRIQANPPRTKEFKVADRVGYTDGVFVLPDVTIDPGHSRLAVCLDDLDPRYAGKYRTNGTIEGAKELLRLARGNSRFILGLSLALVGPVGPLLKAQPVAIQFCADPGTGKTTLGALVSSLWGWSSNPHVNIHLGFGETWKISLSKLGAVTVAHCNAFLFLDETRAIFMGTRKSRADALFDAVMLIKTSMSATKADGTEPLVWYTPILSTSNLSLDQLARDDGVPIDDAYRDQLIDVPNPGDGTCAFEDLHRRTDLAKFHTDAMQLAEDNHGTLARAFVHKLLDWRHSDPDQLAAWPRKRYDYYLRRCRSITDPNRNLLRVHQKFATIYPAERLAVHFKLFPFSRRELLGAILDCERGHVALVASFTGTDQQPVEKLRGYIATNRRQFADVGRGPMPTDFDHENCLGYRAGNKFYLTSSRFEQIMGAEAKQTKRQLHDLGFLRRGAGGKDGQRYVFRRSIGTKRDGKPRHSYVMIIARKILE